MTEFHVEVVRLQNVQKHPNADSLSIVNVHDGYPVVFRTEDFKEGDLAVYIPVDSIVPQTEEWAWLSPPGNLVPRDKDRRIKAKRLRGVFSMGLLVPAPAGATVGEDVAEKLGITKYDPDQDPPPQQRGLPWWKALFWAIWSFLFGLERTPQQYRPAIKPPRLPFMPGYYDIEPFRKYGRTTFEEGEHVVVTEKIHGQNALYVHDGDELHIRSRTVWRSKDPNDNPWAKVAEKYNLATKLSRFPNIVLFGEIYGNNPDMPYGITNRKENGDGFAAFDAFNAETGQWLTHREFMSLCYVLDVPTVPVLAEFVWDKDSYENTVPLAEGKTTLPGANHVREGFVIKSKGPERKILKMHGEGFLTRKWIHNQ